MFELIVLLGAAVGGIGAAAATSAVRVRAEHQLPKKFHREFTRVVPPEESSCSICGRKLDAHNTKVISMPIGGAPLLVCDRIGCILAYSQGQVEGSHQAELSVDA